MASFDGTLKFDTGIEPKGFQEGLKKLDQLSMAGLNALAQTGMDIITGAVRAASDSVLTIGRNVLETGKSFEAAMSQVQATLGITAADVASNAGGAADTMDALTAKAQEMGATTAFTAAQAAEGLNILAMSGYDAETSIAMIENVLSLAAAGNLSLADAATYAAGCMKGFTSEAGGFTDATEASAYYADLIAKGATLAATDVRALGEAMSQAAATADMYGQSAQETEIALLRLAEQNETGSNAATMLSATMKNLYAPTDTAKGIFEELGFSVYDAAHQAKDFNTVVDELDKALDLKYAGDAEGKIAAIQDIFGIQGAEGFSKLITASDEKISSFYAGIEAASGSASAQAEAMLDNLSGDITLLQSALDGLYNAFYSDLNNPLRDLVQTGSGYISTIQKGFEIGGFQGAADALGGVVTQASREIADRAPEVIETGLSVIEGLVGGLTSNAPKILDAGARIFEMLLKSGAETVPRLLTFGGQLLGMLGGALLDNLPLLLDTGKQLILDFVTALADPENLAAMTEAGTEIISLLVSVLTDPEFLPVLFAAGLDILLALVTGISENLPTLVGAAVQIIGMLIEALVEHAVEIATAAMTLLTAIVDAIFDNLPLLADSALAIIEAFVDAITDPENMEKWAEAGSELLSSLLGAVCDLVEIGYNAGDFVRTLFEEIGTKLAETDWAALGKAILDGIFSGLLGVDFDFYDFLDNFGDNWGSGLGVIKDNFVAKLKENFEIHSPSRVMHDEIGENLALGIGEGFTDEMPEVIDDVSGVETELVRRLQIQVEPEISGDADLLARQLRVQVEPGAVEALQAVLPTFHALPPVPADSVPQIIHNTTNYTTNHTQNTQNNAPLPGSDGTTVQVFIGGEQLEPIAVRAIQNANAASGGDTL